MRYRVVDSKLVGSGTGGRRGEGGSGVWKSAGAVGVEGQVQAGYG